MRLTSLKTIVFTCISLLMFTSVIAKASDSTEYQQWLSSNNANAEIIDHQIWHKILKTYIQADHSGINLFAYAQVTKKDKMALDTYINNLSKLDPTSYSRSEQMPYWINLYNAATIQLVLNNYPIDSITELGETPDSFGPWNDKILSVNTQALSLNNIEHDILRANWQDKHIHYAVNCASFSCPNLMAEAFTADNLARLLKQGAKDYINHPRGTKFENGQLKMSSIFEWYKVDFGGNNQDLVAHFKDYADKKLLKRLSGYKGEISHDYNWSLNQPEMNK